MVGGSRLSVARDFVTKAILARRGHPGHWVSVYTFDTECRPLVRLEAGERGLTTAAAALRNLQPDGKQTALLGNNFIYHDAYHIMSCDIDY